MSDEPKTCMTDGSKVNPDHRDIDPETGLQKGYVVLCPEERDKGYVRPLRKDYKHVKCGTITSMNAAIAETYARDPKFYSGTYCTGCHDHFPLHEFRWVDDGSTVGS